MPARLPRPIGLTLLLGVPLWFSPPPASAAEALKPSEPEPELSGDPAELLSDDELPPADENPSTVINRLIREGYAARNVMPAEQITDRQFLRRVMLDLTGRVPLPAETARFLTSDSTTKRADLVDQLLSGIEYPLHLRNELDRLLLAPLTNDGDFRAYLLHAIRTDRRWPTIFRDVMLPPGPNGELKGSVQFLARRVNSVDDMTNDTSRLFFGVSINCAKCHDHPYVSDWLQDHFYGMSAFFHRTYATKAGYLGEKHYGELTFQTVEGEKKPAPYLFLSGVTLDEETREWSKDEIKQHDEEIKKLKGDKDAKQPPAPKFSPRSEFVKLALRQENEVWLARNLVNRTWARLLGTGLVDPPDQMHSSNPASHPELLDWLTRDLIAHKYDLRRLTKAIVLSEAYGLSSQWPDENTRPAPEAFAVGKVRVLTPWQYALAIHFATLHPEFDPATLSDEEWLSKREGWERTVEGLSRSFELPTTEFQISVDEALLFSNNRQADPYLRESGDRIMSLLKTTTDPDASVDLLFASVLTREPETDERAAFRAYLEARTDRDLAAKRHLLWTLLTSPELRFNH